MVLPRAEGTLVPPKVIKGTKFMLRTSKAEKVEVRGQNQARAKRSYKTTNTQPTLLWEECPALAAVVVVRSSNAKP